jgi:hypothetical protein
MPKTAKLSTPRSARTTNAALSKIGSRKAGPIFPVQVGIRKDVTMDPNRHQLGRTRQQSIVAAMDDLDRFTEEITAMADALRGEPLASTKLSRSTERLHEITASLEEISCHYARRYAKRTSLAFVARSRLDEVEGKLHLLRERVSETDATEQVLSVAKLLHAAIDLLNRARRFG